MRGHARLGKGDKRKYPLKTIVERDVLFGFEKWGAPIYRNKLECGHLVRISRDLYGETFTMKQRCRECHDEKVTPKTKDTPLPEKDSFKDYWNDEERIVENTDGEEKTIGQQMEERIEDYENGK